MQARKQKAFEFAADASKQIITLSTGIIALTATFLKDVLQKPGAYGWPLKTAWLLYVVAIVAGMWMLLALTGSLGDNKIAEGDLSIYSSNARIPMTVQLIAFVGAVVFTVVFGWMRL